MDRFTKRRRKLPKLALLAGALLAVGAARAQQAAPAPTSPADAPALQCSVAGMNWNGDPNFRAALHHSQQAQGIRQLACKPLRAEELEAGALRLRLVVSELFNERLDGPKIPALMIAVARRDGDNWRELSRLIVGPDPLDGQLDLALQLAPVPNGGLLRLTLRHPSIFFIEGDTVSAHNAFGWREPVLASMPAGLSVGQNLSIDLIRGEARIAAFTRAQGDTREGEVQLTSTYAARQSVVVRLGWRDNSIVAVSPEVVAGHKGDNLLIDETRANDLELKQAAKTLPAGTEPCGLSGWSDDKDRRGLYVRNAPDGKARVLGIVPPPRKLTARDAFGDEPVKAEFRIVGFKDGWFLIDNIKAPGVAYGAAYPKSAPQPYAGRGWVHGSKIGGAFANGGVPQGRLYSVPHVDGLFTPAQDQSGEPIGGGGGPPKRIFACSGAWAFVEIADGTRGWVRSICSNQATNCS